MGEEGEDRNEGMDDEAADVVTAHLYSELIAVLIEIKQADALTPQHCVWGHEREMQGSKQQRRLHQQAGPAPHNHELGP